MPGPQLARLEWFWQEELDIRLCGNPLILERFKQADAEQAEEMERAFRVAVLNREPKKMPVPPALCRTSGSRLFFSP